MSKIIIRIKGGLGNQLFCYAVARRLALVNNAELVIDDVTGFARDRQYRRRYALNRFHVPARKATPAERMEPFERYRRGLTKLLARRRPFNQRRYVEQDQGAIDFDPRLLALNVEGTVYLDGLWQSEGYFKDVEATIRQDLQIRPPNDSLNLQMAEEIRGDTAVAVHVRWFDRPTSGASRHNAAADYYRRAIEEMEQRVDDPHYFVFSDDPNAAYSMLGLASQRATTADHNLGDENAWADLWLMSQCKHFVIANSTFSWWGAWLGEKENTIVVSPGVVRGRITAWGFSGLIPDRWIIS